MKTMARLRLPDRLLACVARLGSDKRGNAAVEFAVIAPLMLTMFFGTVEFSSAVAVNRKVSMAAQALGDLVSRYSSVTDTDMTNFNNIANAMMTPYSATPLKATITQIYVDPATGVARAQWSKGDVPRTNGTTVPIPANLIARDASNNIIANQYLIFTEVGYLYTPAVGYVMKLAVPLADVNYMRPRLSTCVFYSPSTACTKL